MSRSLSLSKGPERVAVSEPVEGRRGNCDAYRDPREMLPPDVGGRCDEDLPDGEARAIYRPFTTPRLDLSKYENLRLFTHGEGFERRDSVRVLLRLGSNETADYYEIEQPLYPFEPDGAGLGIAQLVEGLKHRTLF